MKAPVFGLAVAAIAFGTTSVYLGYQLREERARAAQVLDTARQLNARIAELETARAELTQSHAAANAGSTSDKRGTPRGGPPPDAASAAEQVDQRLDPRVWSARRVEPSPAMKKMMRSQLQANNRRLYSDVGARLGLTADTANALVDLLTDQQIAAMERVRQLDDPAGVERSFDNQQLENQQAIFDLIGPDKALALQDYQQSLPARQEFQMLSRQLENSGITLTEAQSSQLLDIYVNERKRVPEPQYLDGMDNAEYGKTLLAWQEEYSNRVSERASRVLDAGQLASYNEIQQWQKEMGEQFATVQARPGMPPGMRRMRGAFFAGGGATAVAPLTVSEMIVNAPPATDARHKP